MKSSETRTVHTSAVLWKKVKYSLRIINECFMLSKEYFKEASSFLFEHSSQNSVIFFNLLTWFMCYSITICQLKFFKKIHCYMLTDRGWGGTHSFALNAPDSASVAYVLSITCPFHPVIMADTIIWPFVVIQGHSTSSRYHWYVGLFVLW